ncbi:hypothetical protein AOL_s00078g461 [Orbilia oligospora ATCC 24927]|uniref:Uncharacterized protein n=1 Tax=Arthrobotrys oligospora (strain ATCC 24927 / CBS 115.81 / DSM 1491) TaxID=756982 RepID=G1XC14_ARTOA|nr:hypothetical protein AOL_s00078g461 [Orbilia oligospora ATCC 24927]EGX49428.1 hypothetical protein AOL_s00078g461 [Orbilia oligospora ATCC 24927]
MFSSLLPFLLLPLTFKRTIADSAPEISVEIYFTDYTIHRFKIDPFTPANCNWIPFHFLPGSKTITPRIFAITASPQLPPTIQLDSLDFSIHLGDNAIDCEDTRRVLYRGDVAGEAYNLTLPYYAPGYSGNDVERAERVELRERMFVRSDENALDLDELGNRIWPLVELPDIPEEDDDEGKKSKGDKDNNNNSGMGRKDSSEYLFPGSLGGPDSDDYDDKYGPGFQGFGVPRNSPEKWRGRQELRREEAKEEAKEEEEREEEEKDDRERGFSYVSPPRGGGFSLQLQRRPPNRRQGLGSYSPRDNYYGLGNVADRIYQATGRTLRLRPGEHDPALDIDLSDPEMSAILFPPRQRNPVSQPPKLNTESANAKSDVEELDASPEIFNEDRPLERPLMAEFDAVLGQDANYGDNERLTQTSGEQEYESPIDIGGNFNYDAPDGDQGEGDPDSPVIKKRSLSISPSATKRLHKRVIEVPEGQPGPAQLDLVQPDPVQPDPTEPTPSLGFGEPGQIAMDTQARLIRAGRFHGFQEPYMLFEPPASFVIRAKFSEKKPVSAGYRFRELEDLPPPANYDPDDLISLPDHLLEFLSRERQ